MIPKEGYMRPDAAYWKAYYLKYWQIREKLAKGMDAGEAVGEFLAQRFYENEAKWEIQRLSQQTTAQAA